MRAEAMAGFDGCGRVWCSRSRWYAALRPVVVALAGTALVVGWLSIGQVVAVHGQTAAPARRASGVELPSRTSPQAQAAIASMTETPDARFVPRRSAGGFGLSGGGVSVALGRGGVHVVGAASRLSLRLVAVGRAGRLRPLAQVAPRARTSRVVYARARGVLEWYAAGSSGIEQGFTLARRPPAPAAGAVTLALAVSGLRARLAESDVQFLTQAGRAALRYGALVAVDASGRRLPAWLAVSRSRLLLRVDDHGAHYPLRIDPLVQQAELAPPGASGIGTSVAADGGTVVVGAPSTQIGSHPLQGAVYVYTRSGTAWGVQGVLLASDGNRNDQLGYSVAISRDTIVASAVGSTVNGNYYQGAAYVFVRSGARWIQQAKLTAGNGGLNNWFGNNVAISGDTIVAGAPYARTQDAVGAAYVFTRSGGIWRQQAELTPPDADTHCRGICALGYSVAILGGGGVMSIAAGAPGWEPSIDGPEVGAVYLFTGSANNWSSSPALVADDGAAGDGLGSAVAILARPGTVPEIVAGAPYATVNGQANKGAVYEFLPESGSKWAQTKLTAYYGKAGGLFGQSLAFSGSATAVGAPGSNYQINPPLRGNQGAAYMSPGDQQEQELTASDGRVNDGFGFSLAISSGILVVGGPAGGPNANGAAYIFTLPTARATSSQHVDFRVAGVPRGCATSRVRLSVTLRLSPSASVGSRKATRRAALKVRTVAMLNGRPLLVTPRRAFTIIIRRGHLRVGTNKLLLATQTSGTGTQQVNPNRTWLHTVVFRCHVVRFTG